MAQPTHPTSNNWMGGIQNYPKLPTLQAGYYFGYCVNYRDDPQAITLYPGAVKESGGTVIDLLKWATQLPNTLDSYYYGTGGNIYHRNFQGGWTNLHTAPASSGNGLEYFFADDYLYYTTTTAIGRYGPVGSAPQLIDGWLKGFDNTVWNRNYSTGLESIQTGQVTFTIPAGTTTSGNIQSYSNQFDLTNTRYIFNLISAGDQTQSAWGCGVEVFTDVGQTNGIAFQIQNGNILSRKIIAGTTTQLASTTYSATGMQYLAFSEQAGTLYLEYSANGTSWTTAASLTNPFGTTLFELGFGAGCDSNLSPGTSAIFGPITYQTRLSTPSFTDNFLQSAGGVPTNTASVVLNGTNQYAHAANSASLDITGNLTLETFFKAQALPAVGSSATLVGKWDESGATRSYKMDLLGVSGFFGTGSDGALTISSNTTDAPIDSSCSGSTGQQTLYATNASFASGQQLLIIQMQGAVAGYWEFATIQSYATGVITLTTPLANSYNNTGGQQAQCLVLKQYTTVTVNSGKVWTPKAWNGTTGGILAFLANSTVTITGTINANGGNGSIVNTDNTGAGTGGGFRGGTVTISGNNNTSATGRFGESSLGASAQGNSANGTGGGGGFSPGNTTHYASGGGGGYGSTGSMGIAISGSTGGAGGIIGGANDLSTLLLGAGGGGGALAGGGQAGGGGSGGGIVFINGVSITVTGSITANGGNGGDGGNLDAGGAGAGGAIFFQGQTINAGSSLLSAIGGTGGSNQGSVQGGNGGAGRIVFNYLTSQTGTTTPTVVTIQDNTLVTTPTIQARLGLSSTGSNAQYLTQNLPTLTTGVWNRLSISWTAALSQASFYLNGVLLGTATGTLTAISSNTSLLTVGANNSGSGIANYFNGELNDMRIWGTNLTASVIAANNLVQVPVNSAFLEAYYLFNSTLNDATGNANNLTGVNTPTYTTDVPFPAPTTRLDIDQSFTTTGHTYTLPSTIIEDATDMLSFTPTLDPQKSVAFNVSAPGTGNWTVYVHDQQNRLIAQQTVLNANVLASGYMEITFSEPWRIVIGRTYHFHLVSSVGSDTAAVVTSVASSFATADFYTYYQFLVTDSLYHPIMPFLNFMAIGNERYVATWDGAFYTANKIAFPTGWRVRCFGTWREYLAIGVWKGESITSFTHGRVYFWDGISPTFNFFIDVPDGQINALWGMNTDLFIIAGYRGDILDYQGNFFFDTGNSQSNKLRFIPKRQPQDTIEVFPGAINYYRNLLQIGYAGNSTSTTIGRGVYSYGTYDPKLDSTLSLDYPISTGNMGTTVSIGCVFPVGNELIIGWQDGGSFGADVINFTNNPAPHGRIEGMISDDNAIWHYKANFQLRADFEPLPTGASVDIAYNLDRSGWVTGTVDATVGDTFTKTPDIQGRPRESQYAVDLYATGSVGPTLLGLSAEYQPLTEEQQF